MSNKSEREVFFFAKSVGCIYVVPINSLTILIVTLTGGVNLINRNNKKSLKIHSVLQKCLSKADRSNWNFTCPVFGKTMPNSTKGCSTMIFRKLKLTPYN